MAFPDQATQRDRPRRTLFRFVFALELIFLCCVSAELRSEGTIRATRDPHSESCVNKEVVILQEVAIELTPGDSLSRNMIGGAVDRFRISVSAKQYFQIIVEQLGIVVSVELFRPEGASVIKIENVSGAYGPVYISEITKTPGHYKLEVRSSESWAIPGRYDVRLQELRAPEPIDEARVAAERAFAEAQNLLSRAREQSASEATKSRHAAIEKLKFAANQWHKLTDHHGEAISLYMIGVVYQRNLSESNEAKKFMLEALTLESQLAPNDWRLVASIWNDLGVVYDRLYDEKNARSAIRNALRIFDAHDDRRGRASAHNNLGLVFLGLGQAPAALQAFQVALPIRQAENDKSNELITLNNIGGAYDRLGEPRQALAYYGQALQGWRETNNSSQIPTGLNNVARASDTLGLWQEALNYYQQAAELAQKQGQRRNEAVFLYNMGDLYNRLNDPSLALKNYQAALQINQEIKNIRDEANVLAHIAEIYMSTGQPDQAMENYSQAMQIMESQPKVESRRVQVYTLIGIATVYLGRDSTKALQYSEEARKLSQEVGDRQQEADSLEKMGEAYNALGEHAKAEESFNSALALRRALQDKLAEASTLFLMASLKRDLGQLNEAAKVGEEMLKIVEALHGSVISEQLRTSFYAKSQNYYELYIDVKMRLYQLEHHENHRAEALAANERRRARGLVDALLEANAGIRQGISADLLRAKQENDEQLKIKSRLRQQLLNEVEVDQKILDRQHTPQQLRRVNDLKQRLSNISRDVNNLIIEKDTIQTRIKLNSPRFAALILPTTISVEEIQRQLADADTQLLEYSLGDNRSYVWVVSQNSLSGFQLPARDQIEPVARRVTEALTERNRKLKIETLAQERQRIVQADAEFVEASAQLSKMVLEPVASLLGNKKRLVVVADGALQLIPFAALPVPGSSSIAQNAKNTKSRAAVMEPRPLITEYEIVTLPSASVLALQRRELANRKPAPYAVAVLADPVFDLTDERVAKAKRKAGKTIKETARKGQGTEAAPNQGLPNSAAPTDSSNGTSLLTRALRDVGIDGNLHRLVYSRKEATAISRLAQRNQSFSALDFQANRQTATSPELSKYRIVHFAAHGIMDLDHPELSGIVLSMVDEKGGPQDGYFRLHEIYNLNLPAELVVLSACQTGVGKQIKGEGLIALTRGFMYAGAKSVVASLWKVDDVATSELMAEFYRQMFTNKLKPAAALRQAQINLSQQKHRSSPYFWAGFFLQGEWNLSGLSLK